MILLDTDHVTLLKYPAGDRAVRLRQRLESLPPGEAISVPVIVVEEQMRGWLATVAKERVVRRQIQAYRELSALFEFFAEFDIVVFDERAATEFDSLRSAKLRLGTMDLKIAATAQANQALLPISEPQRLRAHARPPRRELVGLGSPPHPTSSRIGSPSRSGRSAGPSGPGTPPCGRRCRGGGRPSRPRPAG